MNRIFTAVLLFAAASAFAETPEQIVRRFYPQYVPAEQCYRVRIADAGEYCTRLLHKETVNGTQGRLMYLLYGGDVYDFVERRPDGSHAVNGMAGLFVLQEQGSSWKLAAALPHTFIGSFGSVPPAKEWQFLALGPGRYGFLSRHSDVHQGFAGSHYVLLHDNGNKGIGVSLLGAHYSNTGAYGDRCEIFEDEPAERKRCLKKLSDLSAELTVLRKQPPVNGFYPLQLTVNGFQGASRLRNLPYTVLFQAKQGQYVAPNHYPLKDIDY